jgi:hypothetical protein
MAAELIKVGVVTAANIVWGDFDIELLLLGEKGFIKAGCGLAENGAEVSAAEATGFIELTGWDINVQDGNMDVVNHYKIFIMLCYGG